MRTWPEDYSPADAAIDDATDLIEEQAGHCAPWHCAECGQELSIFDIRDSYFEYTEVERRMFGVTSHTLESRCCDAEVI